MCACVSVGVRVCLWVCVCVCLCVYGKGYGFLQSLNDQVALVVTLLAHVWRLQLLDACSQALGMSRARRLFTIDGQPLAFEDIKRDMEVRVCVCVCLCLCLCVCVCVCVCSCVGVDRRMLPCV